MSFPPGDDTSAGSLGDDAGARGPDDESLPWLEAYAGDFLVDMGSHAELPGGVVYIVGAGPGDATLLTIRGRLLLDRCDVIVHDEEVDPELLRRSDGRRAPAELHLAVTSDDRSERARGESPAGLLVRLAREGKRVVRLIEGDPFASGRGSEEAQALSDSGLAFEVVPGVISETAAAAYAGIPVIHPGMSASVTLLGRRAAAAGDDRWAGTAAMLACGGSLTFQVGPGELKAAATSLIRAGAPEDIPAAAIAHSTRAGQRGVVVATLQSLHEEVGRASLPARLTVIVGWTVVLHDELAWAGRRQLDGVRILLLGPSPVRGMAEGLRELGGEVVALKATTEEAVDPAALHEALQWLEQYDWIIFTSAHTVTYFWKELRAAGRDARALAGNHLAAVGRQTRHALRERGLEADVGVDRDSGGEEAVLEELASRHDVPNSRVLCLMGEDEGAGLPAGLEQLGAMVEVVPLFRAVPDEGAASRLRDLLEGEIPHVVVLSSPVEARALAAVGGARTGETLAVVAVGADAALAARELGLAVRAEVDDGSVSSVADTIGQLAG